MGSDLKKKTAKGLAWGGTFSLLQQLMGLCFSVFIARILTPSDYGMIGMLSIFVTLATVLQESGFVFVLTNRKNINRTEYSTVFWFNVIVSFTIYFLFFLSAPLLGIYFKNEQIVPLSRIVFLGFFISSFGVIQSAVLYKEMKVKERGVASIVGLFFSGIFGLVLASNGFAYWGLAMQGLVLTLVTTVILWIYSPFRPSFVFDLHFISQTFPDGAKYAMSNFVAAISGNVYSLILGRYYAVKDVGFYSQATKFNSYGYSLILSMVRNVSQPMLVQVKDDHEKLLAAYRKLLRFTALMSIPVMLGIGMVAPDIIPLVLSSKWCFVGYLLRIICVGGAFVSLTTLASYFFVCANMSSLYMWFGIISSSFRICIAILASFNGVISLAIACAVLDIVEFLFSHLVVHNRLKYPYRLMFWDLFPVLITSIGALVVAYSLTVQIHSIIYLLVVRVLMSVFLFLLFMNFWKYDVYEEMKLIIIARIKKYI